MLQQGTENIIFRVTFGIDFVIMTTMILQNTISRFNIFEIKKVFTAKCVTFKSHRRKGLLNLAARNREEHFLSYHLNWL